MKRILSFLAAAVLAMSAVAQPSMPTLRPLANLLQEMRATGEIAEAVFQKVARENAIRELGL